jgi:hypothetical protein
LRDSTILAIILVCLVLAAQFNFSHRFDFNHPERDSINNYGGVPRLTSFIGMHYVGAALRLVSPPTDGFVYFLTKYKKKSERGKTIGETVTSSLHWNSMFYTAIILFFGFWNIYSFGL